MKFIHIADIHLGAKPDKKMQWSQEREKEIWESFAAIIDIAAQEKADLLLIAGDLFHYMPTVSSLKRVDGLFSGISGTRVVLIAGNHDYLSAASKYNGFEWSDNVFFIASEKPESLCFEDINTEICGLSLQRRNETRSLLEGIKAPDNGRINILMAHGGEAGNLPIDFKELANAGYDYVALGHIHRPCEPAANIRYSGSPEPLDRNETGEHGYIIGEIDGGVCHTEFVPFAVRKYIHMTLETDTEVTEPMLSENISRIIAEYGSENIYCFRLEGYRNPDISFDTERLAALGNIAEIRDETAPAYNFESLLRENEDNVIGMYIRGIMESGATDAEKNAALYIGLEALLKDEQR